MPSNEQVELLIRATHFDIGFEHHRVITLHQRIKQFVHADRQTFTVTLLEIVALQHTRQGVPGCQADHALGAKLAHPFRVETDPRLGAVQYPEYLGRVSLGILPDCFPG